MRSDNERTLLNLIERVMSNLTGVEEKPQHVEVRVQEKAARGSAC